MSEDERMDEKFVALQYELVNTKLAAIAKTLDIYVEENRKIVDDHEQRLREQAKELSKSEQQITGLQLELKDVRNDLIVLKEETSKKLDEIVARQKEKDSRELTLCQTFGMEAIKYIAFGAGGSGAVMIILRLLGINF